MIDNAIAAKYALLARDAEDMFADGSLEPPAAAGLSANYAVVAYLTAANALFGAQQVGLGQRTYFGFLARSISDGQQFVAVLRGTHMPVEWAEDMFDLFFPSAFGNVDSGFYTLYESMRIKADAAALSIASLLPAGAVVTVIGHSLGAALATYLMFDLARMNPRHFSVRGAIFCSPRTGDAKFVQNVDQAVGHDNYAVFNYLRDIVPHCPPALPLGIGYQDLPGVRWIKPAEAEAIIDNSPVCNHHATSIAAMLDFSTADLKNKCIKGPGPAYAKAA